MINQFLRIYMVFFFALSTACISAVGMDQLALQYMEIGQALEILAFGGAVYGTPEAEKQALLESLNTGLKEQVDMVLAYINQLPEKAQLKITRAAEKAHTKLLAAREKCTEALKNIQFDWNQCNGNCEEQTRHRTTLGKNLIKHLTTFLLAFKKYQLSVASVVYNELLMIPELQNELARDEASLDTLPGI